MNEYRYYSNRLPSVARGRLDTARMYRELRKTNPAAARLLFKRLKLAQRKISDALMMFSTGDNGLERLLK